MNRNLLDVHMCRSLFENVQVEFHHKVCLGVLGKCIKCNFQIFQHHCGNVRDNTQGTDAVPMPQCTWCRRNERTMSSVKQLNFETKLRKLLKLLMRSSETGGENGSMKLTQSQSEILFPNSNATFNRFPKLEGPGFAHQVGQRRSGFVCSAGFSGSSRTPGTLTAAYMHDSEMKDILFLKRW